MIKIFLYAPVLHACHMHTCPGLSCATRPEDPSAPSLAGLQRGHGAAAHGHRDPLLPPPCLTARAAHQRM